MSIASIANWIQSIGVLTDLRESSYVWPVVLSIHLSCIAVFGSMILMTDLRLLGVALTDYSVSQVVGGLKLWKRVGGTIMITMGILLGTCEADKYIQIPYFWIKMTLLLCIGAHALIFRPRVYNRTGEIDKLPKIPVEAKLAAVLSLVLWLGVLTMGRMIGYWEGVK